MVNEFLLKKLGILFVKPFTESTKLLMKKLIFYISILLFFSGFISQTENINRKAPVFTKGEVVTFRLHYGFITAGEATVKVIPQLYRVNNKICYKFDVEGRTTGMFRRMMEIKDRWLSYVDTTSLLPQIAYREIKEANYRLWETTTFKQGEDTLKVEYKKKPKETYKAEFYKSPQSIHDIVSAYFYLRNIEYSNMKIGERVKINAFLEDTVYPFEIIYNGKEIIKTEFGKVHALKLTPDMPNNDLFDGSESINIWLSDDKNRVPLKVEAKMFVGAVEMDIEKYEGLKYPLNFAK